MAPVSKNIRRQKGKKTRKQKKPVKRAKPIKLAMGNIFFVKRCVAGKNKGKLVVYGWDLNRCNWTREVTVLQGGERFLLGLKGCAGLIVKSRREEGLALGHVSASVVSPQSKARIVKELSSGAQTRAKLSKKLQGSSLRDRRRIRKELSRLNQQPAFFVDDAVKHLKAEMSDMAEAHLFGGLSGMPKTICPAHSLKNALESEGMRVTSDPAKTWLKDSQNFHIKGIDPATNLVEIDIEGLVFMVSGKELAKRGK